jgi:hypothetical protein
LGPEKKTGFSGFEKSGLPGFHSLLRRKSHKLTKLLLESKGVCKPRTGDITDDLRECTDESGIGRQKYGVRTKDENLCRQEVSGNSKGKTIIQESPLR